MDKNRTRDAWIKCCFAEEEDKTTKNVAKYCDGVRYQGGRGGF